MMKKIIIGLIVLVFMIQLVNAADVCVVVDYGNGEPDSKCVEIDAGKNGYELLEEMGWSIEWVDFGGTLGHALCGINDVGGTSDNCWIGNKYWNLRIAQNNEWQYFLDKGFDGTPHYETKNGDVLGLAYGEYGSKPNMFTVNISKIYVDGDKQRESKTRSGKIVDVFPESVVKFKIELENKYDSSTDIEVTDISIEGTIEDIDDGDDIDEEIKEFNLGEDKKKTEELKFTIPLEVEAKDRLVRILIEAEDDAGIKYEMEFTFDLEVEKEKHDVRITNSALNKDSYECGTNALLSVSLLNIGEEEEDVKLSIVNEDLDLDIIERFELSDDVFKSSSKFEKRFNLWIPDNAGEGTYSIKITSDYGSEEEITNVDLVIGDCGGVVKAEEPEESEGVTDVQTGDVSDDGDEGTEAEITGDEEEITTLEEGINGNMPLILGGLLIVLIIIIFALGIGFFVVRR